MDSSKLVAVFIATHNITGLKYLAKTYRFILEKDIQKYYHGSGLYWKNHLNKYGNDVTIRLLGVYPQGWVHIPAINYSKEFDIINSCEWANIIIEDGLGGGSSGNNKKWSIEMLKSEAKKYNTRNDFNKGSRNAYSIAHNRGILDEICKHMDSNIKYTIKYLNKESLKYKSKKEFRESNRGAYDCALRKNILDNICKHMNIKPKWSKEIVSKIALNYTKRLYFYKNERNAYNFAMRNNILNEVCKHMNTHQTYLEKANLTD